MGKYKYLFYDFDGTIANTYEGVAIGLEATFKKYGVDVDKSLYSKYIGPPLSETFTTYMHDKAYEAVAYFRKIYNETGAINTTTMYDGIAQTIKELHNKGYIVCVASCKKHEEAVELLKKFGIYDYIDFVSGLCYNLRETKRDVLQYAIEYLKADIKDCVMIGDTKFDVEGAQELNMDCILCLWGFGEYDKINNSNVVYRAINPYDAQKFIED